MLFAVIFEDNLERAVDIRKEHMPNHVAYLERNLGSVQGPVQAAGALVTADGGPAGGMWLVEAENEAAVEKLVHADPFWPTGLRKSVKILHWRQAYAGGKRV